MNPIRQQLFKKIKSLAIIGSGGAATFAAICIIRGNEKFYSNVLLPTLHSVCEPETAHSIGIFAAKWNFLPHIKAEDSPILKTDLWGLHFKNPVGIAAGFDKDGEAVSGLFKTGIGFLEVGSVTPKPQDGNPKPRIFRLKEDQAVINRCGFNSKGHEYVQKRLQVCDRKKGILGVNLGKNKSSNSAEADYVQGIQEFGLIADYLVINVSSPNTPGLRALQKANALESLLDKVIESRNILPNKVPILVKIAPDLSDEEKKDIARVVQRKGKEIDGLIVSNTTIKRPETLSSQDKKESGGLSGKPLHLISTQTIREMFKHTNGRIPIVGVGGVSTGKEAYEKIKAGASLIEVYTALIYFGPPVIEKIKKELEELILADGYSNISEAVGADHKNR